jgi:SAM-dependent methyltransferase
MQRAAPREVQGIDPSDAQLRFARQRPGAEGAVFREGDAMALPFDPRGFDAAVMALVIFFVPEPAKGLAEMMRVVRPGGMVAAYAWDMLGGGFPFDAIQAELRGLGVAPLLPPSVGISRMPALHELWTSAGLEAVETREIGVQRIYADFEEFWSTTSNTGSLRATLAAMPPADRDRLKARVAARLPADASGRLTCQGRANAIKGRVPLRP